MGHLLHVFLLIRLHKLMPITNAYQWNAHDHLEYTTPRIKILKEFSKADFDKHNLDELILTGECLTE